MLRKLVPELLLTALGLGAVLFACVSDRSPGDDTLKLASDPRNYKPLEKYEPMKIPDDNPMTEEKATLGWKLFFDARLSGKGDRACYSCHLNEKGLTDGLAKNTSAIDGKPLKRNTPTLWNIGYQDEWYWDGRAKTLEGQALAAWKLANMGAKDPAKDAIREDVIARINAVKEYRDRFQKVFGGPADEKNVVKALACFVRTIVSQTTAFDKGMMSQAAQRGWKVFNDAKCTNCHVGVLLTSKQYYNVGIGMNSPNPDLGRFDATKKDEDKGKFKAPTLRDVARTAPYFHDGSIATLEEAVQLMVGGGIENPNIDRANLQKQNLSDDQIKELIEFLKALTETAELKRPKLP